MADTSLPRACTLRHTSPPAWRCSPANPKTILLPQTHVCLDKRLEKLTWSGVLSWDASHLTPSQKPSAGWWRRPWGHSFASRCPCQLQMRDACNPVRPVWPDQTPLLSNTCTVGTWRPYNRNSTCTNYFTFATSESFALRLSKETVENWRMARRLLRHLLDRIATSQPMTAYNHIKKWLLKMEKNWCYCSDDSEPCSAAALRNPSEQPRAALLATIRPFCCRSDNFVNV